MRRAALIIGLSLTLLVCVTPLAAAGTSAGAKVVGTIPVPNTGNILVFAGSLWVTNKDAGTLTRIDPAKKRILATIHVGNQGTQLAGGEGSVWVTNYAEDTVSRVDPATNSVVATIPVGQRPEGIAVTPGAVWVGNHIDGTVTKIDTNTNLVVDTIHTGGGPQFMAAGDDGVWVGVVRRDHDLVRIDPATDRVVAKISLPITACGAVAVTPAAIWVAGGGCDLGIVRVDPGTNSVVDTVGTTANVLFIASGFGSVWYTELFNGTLVRIDPKADAIVGRLQLGGEFAAMGIATDSTFVWVGDDTDETVFELKPL
jgi:YVTN family beta-propeller protein